ncbi:MAG TPA: SprB repeat-containing protein, partial [Bacteroidales bacterium]|nr:SprB repeat-containing protein [Bacteroidales bacterium]
MKLFTFFLRSLFSVLVFSFLLSSDILASGSFKFTTENLTCNGIPTGKINVTITGGGANYKYELWEGIFPSYNFVGESSWISNSTYSFENLAAKKSDGITDINYVVVVRFNSNTNDYLNSGTINLAEPAPLDPGEIGTDQNLCNGADPALLTNVRNASGGNGTIQWDWESSPDGILWTSLAKNTPTYDPLVSSTIKYRRKAW